MAGQRGLVPEAGPAAGPGAGQTPPFSRGETRDLRALPGSAQARAAGGGGRAAAGISSPPGARTSHEARRRPRPAAPGPGEPAAGQPCPGPLRAEGRCQPCRSGPRAAAVRGGAVTRGPVISRLGGVSRDFPERRCLPAAAGPRSPPRSPSPQAGGRPRADMDEQFQPVSAARIGAAPGRRWGGVSAGPRDWAGGGAGTPRVGWEMGVCRCPRGGR